MGIMSASLESTSSQTRRRSYRFILLFVVLALLYEPLFRFCYNLLFLGYDLFGEMRWAAIFFAVCIRLLSYPVRLLSIYTRHLEAKADRDHQSVEKIEDPLKRKAAEKNWLMRNQTVLLFLVFQLTFYIAIALISGRIFLSTLTPERTQGLLYQSVPEPEYPLSTVGWIPLVGEVDLTRVNNRLNFFSAIGAGIVGLFEVVIHRKTKKRELWMYLIGYPLGAYFITSQVPSGFEFSMVIFEALTILTIFVEKLFGSLFKRLLANPDRIENARTA